MAKARTKAGGGRQPGSTRFGRFRLRRWEQVVVAAIVLGVSWAVWSWATSRDVEQEFLALLPGGVARLGGIQTVPDGGNAHLEDVTYTTEFPTTGPHHPTPLAPSYYSSEQRPAQLVHSLEHGIVVIYYDAPGDEALRLLRGWASTFAGPWSGVIVTKKKGLGRRVVLAAWRNLLRQEQFDPVVAAAFVDRFRGRGPENPVR
ncbi:MAG: DUF3105 domain-containing protein [Alphaproteobacteria bacterium]|nr:DUF3105 domain-containing protein [Alphaproteobacteria bacterium]